jgi:diguanylate cyclase (GGDEF)-like protein
MVGYLSWFSWENLSHVNGVYPAIKYTPCARTKKANCGLQVDIDDTHGAIDICHNGAVVSSTIWDDLTTSHGQRLLASQDGLRYAPIDNQPARRFDDELVGSVPCRVLLERKGSVWVGNLHGLFKVDPQGKVVEQKTVDGGRFGYVYVMTEDSQGQLWVGTLGRGLWRETSAGFEHVVQDGLLPSGNTYVIAMDSDRKQTLVIQDDRIMLVAHGKSELITSLHPIAGWSALWLNSSTIAIGSSDGLYTLDLIERRVRSRINALLPEGGWEFTNNRTLVLGRDKRLYCGTSAGLVAVTLAAIEAFQEPPQLVCVEVKWRDTVPSVVGSETIVRPGKWSVEVIASACWFVDEGQVQYRFRLIGFEPQWSAFQRNPGVSYSSLPPGRYALEAQATSALTGEGTPTVLLRVHVQASWFSSLANIAISSATRLFDNNLRASSRNRMLNEENLRLESDLVIRTRRLSETNKKLLSIAADLRVEAMTDALTSLGNRRHLDQRMANEVERAKRTRTSLGILVIDVDHFKLFNDRYGHIEGDACLRDVAKVLRDNIRPYDFAARFGGEEFVIVLPGAGRDEVLIVAERLLTSMRALRRENFSTVAKIVTISIGAATELVRGDAVELMSKADAALYQAKQSGRDRVCLAE